MFSVSSSDRAWRVWGAVDPYFGVLTDEKFRKQNLANHREEFFQSGDAHIRQRIEKFERHFGPLARGRALDFGCGVGRLTLPLAKVFGEAVGVDISPAMLEEAQRNAAAQGITNAMFVSSDDQLSLATGTYDFVHTYIVLQHIPVPRGLEIIGQLLDRTAPGGGINLHMSIDRRDSPLQTARYWGQRYIPGVQGLSNLVRGRNWGEPLMQMNSYPLPKIFEMLNARGFGDVLLDFEYHGRVLTGTLVAQRG